LLSVLPELLEDAEKLAADEVEEVGLGIWDPA
jgi:hypothetical protein